MPAKGAARGRDRELRYAEYLEETEGGLARRFESGCFDIVWLRGHPGPVLIQVKSTKASAYERFGPKERLAAMLQAARAEADAVLVWWPPGSADPKSAKWIPASEWPPTPGWTAPPHVDTQQLGRFPLVSERPDTS